jgi:hypothetical protein
MIAISRPNTQFRYLTCLDVSNCANVTLAGLKELVTTENGVPHLAILVCSLPIEDMNALKSARPGLNVTSTMDMEMLRDALLRVPLP